MRKPDDIIKAVYRKDYAALAAASPAELDAADADGRTPLMHAVLEGDTDMVRVLIERNVDLDAADRAQKWTALHFAARDQNAVAVRLLLDAGAKVDPTDVFGNTPLWRSVMSVSADPAAIRELVRRGAEVNRKNAYGEAPMDVARKRGRDDIAAVLQGIR
jgi:ankyrin repeat protein